MADLSGRGVRGEPRYWGKYRGKVVDNLDPLFLARLLVQVPAVPGMILNWALPCVPYAGVRQGFFALPPVGADVWVEFEAGQADYPIWSGCFWEDVELPPAAEAAVDGSLVKELQSEFAALVLNDTPEEGGVTLTVTDPAVAVPVLLTMTSTGLSITVGAMTLLMDPEVGITISAGDTVLTLTEESLTMTAPTIMATAEPAVLVMAEEGITMEAPTVVATAEPAVLTVSEASITLEAPTVEATAEADLNLAAATVSVETGEANVTSGTITVESGETNLVGVLTIEGETNLAGALTIEGDLALAGAGEVAGDLAVLGVIVGVVVPPI
jgi:hypothetical protein